MNWSQRHTNKSSTELWLHKSCSAGMMFFATEFLKSESSPQDGTQEWNIWLKKKLFKKTYGNLEWEMMILCIVHII